MFTEILVLCMHCLYSVICHQYGTNSWVSLMCNVLESTTLTTISNRAVELQSIGGCSAEQHSWIHFSVLQGTLQCSRVPGLGSSRLGFPTDLPQHHSSHCLPGYLSSLSHSGFSLHISFDSSPDPNTHVYISTLVTASQDTLCYFLCLPSDTMDNIHWISFFCLFCVSMCVHTFYICENRSSSVAAI